MAPGRLDGDERRSLGAAPDKPRSPALSLAATALAILVLLVTPGPTNTLLALAGAERGWRAALRLIPAELGGYLGTVVPLALLGTGLLAALPAAKVALTLVAGLWVLWLALRLWRGPRAGGKGATVTARRVTVTTLLNPKALVFGLALLPAPDWGRLLANLGLFATEVVAVAMLWAALGALLARRRPGEAGLPQAIRQVAAGWLGALGIWLLLRAGGLA